MTLMTFDKIEVVIYLQLLVCGYFSTVSRCLHNMPHFSYLVNTFPNEFYKIEKFILVSGMLTNVIGVGAKDKLYAAFDRYRKY